MDTIFAQATAPGRAGVSVVRISGSAAFEAGKVFGGEMFALRRPFLRRLLGHDSELIDQALVLTFQAPSSFTGEDVVELHLHGSVAVVAAVLDRLGQHPGFRHADAGEFTRRALENNKLDLAQVEGLADLIDSETEAQRKLATRVFSGSLGDTVDGWRTDLIRAAALLEATIDFADEEVPVDVTPEVRSLIAGVGASIEKEISGVGIAERVRNGFEIAIVGAPNSGKSTLLNKLAGRDAAITSDVAGTTRDIVEVRMDLRGLPVTLLDTAGLRETDEVVEKLGIDRALQRASDADLRIFLKYPGEDFGVGPMGDDIILHPKADLHPDVVAAVSGVSGYGVDALINRVSEVLENRVGMVGTATHQRHRIAMENSLRALRRAEENLDLGSDFYEIVAEDLRASIHCLEEVVGRIGVENLLDEIFSSFCIGK